MDEFLRQREISIDKANFALMAKHLNQYLLNYNRTKGWFIDDIEQFCQLLVETYQTNTQSIVELMNHKKLNRFFLDIDDETSDELLIKINKVVEYYTDRKCRGIVWFSPPKKGCHIIWPDVILTYYESYQLTRILKNMCGADAIMYIPSIQNATKIPIRAYRAPLCKKRLSSRIKIPYGYVDDKITRIEEPTIDMVRDSLLYFHSDSYTENKIDEEWSDDSIKKQYDYLSKNIFG